MSGNLRKKQNKKAWWSEFKKIVEREPKKKHILVKQLVKVAQRKWDYGEHVTNFTLEVMLCLTFGVIFK